MVTLPNFRFSFISTIGRNFVENGNKWRSCHQITRSAESLWGQLIMTDGATDRAIDRITFPLVVSGSARARPEQRHDFTASAVMKLSVRSPQFRRRGGGQRDIVLLLSRTPIFLSYSTGNYCRNEFPATYLQKISLSHFLFKKNRKIKILSLTKLKRFLQKFKEISDIHTYMYVLFWLKCHLSLSTSSDRSPVIDS